MHVETDAEGLDLRATLRDLVALSAMPALWIGSEPQTVAAGLADALVGLLQLDFAFVRLSAPGDAEAIEVIRGCAWKGFSEWLEGRLATSTPFPRREILPNAGDEPSPRRGFAVPVGVNGEGGVVAVACERSDFPTQTDELLLSLAANHAAAAFQSSRLIHERKRAEEELRRARSDLEVVVAERTADLRVANDALSALRRLATLVAKGLQAHELFAVVAEEVARVIDVPRVSVLRYEAGDTATECASFSTGGPVNPVGTRWSLDGTSVVQLVRASSEPARIDDYSRLEGELAEAARRNGIHSTVGAPIVVAGRPWGVVLVSSTQQHRLPEGTEARLVDFTELLATAIENADAREALGRLADEQAALSRVATLAAQGAPAEELFAAAVEEVGRLLPVESAAMGRYDPDGKFTTVAAWSAAEVRFPVGGRWSAEGKHVTGLVLRTGRPARLDDFSDASGPVGVRAREAGYRSAVGCPIVVDGRLWGVMTAATTAEEPLPADTDVRLASFTELMATAIGSAESRARLARLAEEQAALRRVAVLVARQPSPVEVFTAVTEAVGPLLGADLAAMHVFSGDGTATTIAGWSAAGPMLPVGTQLPLDGDSAVARIFHTGAAARLDSYDGVDGETAEVARGLRLRSTVGAPILVEGRLWGALMAATRGAEPLPEDAESRIAAFTELVATAVSNAQAREDRDRLADQQAALRRVATLVAEGARPADVLECTAREVARVTGVPMVTIDRYDSDGHSTVVASVDDPGFPVGSRWPLDGPSVGRTVLETARPGRIDDYAELESSAAAAMRGESVNSAVGVPIVVDGRVWGVVCVGTTDGRPVEEGIEARLTDFTELIATAIARTESREALRQLADEQAALRRVATLVAQGVPPADIFAAVSREVERVAGPLLDPSAAATVVRFDPGPECVLVGASKEVPETPLGTRWLPHDLYVSTRVLHTGRSARVDESDLAAGVPEADALRRQGYLSQVASPIGVEGRLWGAMTVSARETLPPGTEERLGKFTELVATAIANAESREARRRLSNQQEALRRVATLVAEGVQPTDLYAVMAEEIGLVCDIPATSVVRYESDGTATEQANYFVGQPRGLFPVGVRMNIEGVNILRLVRDGSQPARIDDYSQTHGEMAEIVRAAGVRSTVGVPIVAAGRLWGAMVGSTTEPEPLPDDTASRMTEFTELLATAIENAESREALERLAEEQAALRRVATLVAQGARPTEVFWAVSDEVGRLFGTQLAAVGRFEPDGKALELVGAGQTRERWDLADFLASAEVLRTGRSARTDAPSWASAAGETAERIRSLGIVSTVASPIVVEGELWGSMLVASTDEALPPDTERRLENFTEVVATAIANAESRSELAASRRRIVTASDEARRRIERNLHDGTQQRLVTLLLELAALKDAYTTRPLLAAELARLESELAAAVDELRELSRGIHPGVLSEAGLGPALRALARRSLIPIALDVAVQDRLPQQIEVAAYYVVSESLANATKHAQASRVDISLAPRDGSLLLSIRDDGVGGAVLRQGSGLVGLHDRVDALGGTVEIDSPPGGGTSLVVTLPLEVEPTAAATE